MRLEERCACGGEIVVVYEAGRAQVYNGADEMDRPEARKHIDNFRRRHKDCLRRDEPATEEPTNG